MKALLAGGAAVNFINGMSSLAIAAATGRLDVLSALLAGGASVSGRLGGSALIEAYGHGFAINPRVVDTLIAAGAQEVGPEGMNDLAVLVPAAAQGDLPEINRLLAAGAAVNATTKLGISALMVASDKGHLSVVLKLIQSRAAMEFTCAPGRSSALARARGQGAA